MDKAKLARFTRGLTSYIDAGLPLVQCLEILASARHETDPEFVAVLHTVRADITGDASFSGALRKHPAVFDDLYVNLVLAGELGGILDTMLMRLAGHLEKDLRLTGRFEQLVGKDIAGGLRSLFHFCENVMGAKAFGDAILKAPGIGELMMKTECTHFCRTIATLLSSGVSLREAVEIVTKSTENGSVQAGLRNAHYAMVDGTSLSNALEEEKIFPLKMIRMIETGEQAGPNQLETMLHKIADIYEEEVETAFPVRLWWQV